MTAALTATGHPDRMTQADLLALLTERFGADPHTWAFQCPACGDIATATDFTDALAEHPRTRKDGTAVTASDRIGQECIGRTLGALNRSEQPWTGRGCDWTAYGLFGGPVIIDLPDGATMFCFPVAPAPTPAG